MVVEPPAGGVARVTFADYHKIGDSLALIIDAGANRLTGLRVMSYMDTFQDTVDLSVRFGRLADDTGYAEEATLEASAKQLRVLIQNSGHRPMQP
jgi:hypothetical protein